MGTIGLLTSVAVLFCPFYRHLHKLANAPNLNLMAWKLCIETQVLVQAGLEIVYQMTNTKSAVRKRESQRRTSLILWNLWKKYVACAATQAKDMLDVQHPRQQSEQRLVGTSVSFVRTHIIVYTREFIRVAGWHVP